MVQNIYKYSTQELEMFKPVPIKLKRGEAVFHHPLAVHGSLENKYRAMVLMAMAIIMAMIMVSMEVLQKSKGQWCPCRCGEGNDIDIGVLGILQI